MKVKIPIEIPIILPIHIKGKNAEKDIDALLDTGSTYTVISPEDILDLGYEISKKKVNVLTAGGTISAPLIKINEIDFLGFKRENVDVLVKDLTDVEIDSILGWSFLKYFAFKINPLKRILEMEDNFYE